VRRHLAVVAPVLVLAGTPAPLAAQSASLAWPTARVAVPDERSGNEGRRLRSFLGLIGLLGLIPRRRMETNGYPQKQNRPI